MMRPILLAAMAAMLAALEAPARAETTTSDATPSATEGPAPTPTAEDRTTTSAEGKSRADHFRIGVIGGVGFPRPFAVEGIMKIERTVALGLEYSTMPSTNFGGVQLGWHALALDARIFPFQNAFFLGARVARQHFDGSASVNAGSYGTYSGSVTTDTWYVEPRLGFLWTARFGLTIGTDLGLEVPLSHSSTESLPQGVTLPSSISRVESMFGSSVLPTVTLLSVGGIF